MCPEMPAGLLLLWRESHCPVSIFHTFIVSASVTETITFPSGLIARQVIRVVRPLCGDGKVEESTTALAPSRSQTLTVREGSLLATTSQVPSGLVSMLPTAGTRKVN